jgi:hypothetical protein
MHVHAYNHLLTLTTATVTDRVPHQPWAHGSPDAHEPGYHVPQVYRSMQGSSPRRCRALPRRLPRWPAGLQQLLHARATATKGGGVFRSVAHVCGARWAAAAAHGAA